MSKKISKYIIISSLLVALVTLMLLANKANAPKINSANNNSSSTNSNPAPISESAKSYVVYSESALVEATGQKVLFFHASWCIQCRKIEQDILEKGVPQGYTIIKVDYDKHKDLRAKYGVTLQTTFVKIDNANKKIGDNYVAYNEPTIEAIKRDYLTN